MSVRVSLILVPAIVAAACATPPAAPEPAAVSVPVITTEVIEVDWPSFFEVGGAVVARETAAISSRIVAPVASVRVRPGDRVRRGAVLVVLEAADLAAHAVRASESSTAAEHAGAAAAAELRSATSALSLARATYDRINRLAADRSATAQELDEAAAARAAAESRQAAAEARVAEARAGLAANRAAGRAAEITAGFAVMTAPFDGIVTERHVDPGSLAAPGAPLLVIENPSSHRLEVHVDASRAGQVRIGQRLPVRVDSGDPDAPWQDGRVSEVSRVDPAGHDFAARIDLPPGPWRSGAFGRARLAGAARRTLVVPSASVIQRGQLHYVFVAGGDGHARLRAISVGALDGARTEILDGLMTGERVVAPVPPTLRDGDRLTIGGRQ